MSGPPTRVADPGATRRQPDSAAGYRCVEVVEFLGLLIGECRPGFRLVEHRLRRVDQRVGGEVGIILFNSSVMSDSTGTKLVWAMSLA